MSPARPALIAVSGPIGSGKTTLAELLSASLGWPRAGYGDVARDEAARLGHGQDRHHLQQVGAQLIAAGWEPFTRRVLARAGWSPGRPVIVAYLDLPARDGLDRARRRDKPGAPARAGDAEHPVEQDLPRVRDHADLILPATAAPRDLVGRVITFLEAASAQSPEHGHA